MTGEGQAIKQMKRAAFLLGLLVFSGPVVADEWSSLPKDFPKNVRDFMLRRLNCRHWDEEGLNPNNFSPAEMRRLRREIAALKCDTLGKDEVTLQKQYARNSSVQQALSASIDWDPPQHKQP